MGDPVGELHSRLCELLGRLERLEARVARLEAPSQSVIALGGAREDESPLAPTTLPQGTLVLLGRSLLVLAGAYVVRALTDSHALPAPVGVALGVAYAAFWQLRADREALAGRVASAAFHDLASSLIAFPLVWEATARFGLLPPAAAAAALVGFFALGLAVSWHRRLLANAVVTTLLTLATAVALVAATHDLLAGLVALLAVAVGLEWLAFRGAWLGLRWLAAVVLDGMAFLTVAVLTRSQLPEGYLAVPPAAAVLALLALPALYLTSVAARTLLLGHPVTAFEVVQGSAAVGLGFGGSIAVLAAHGLGSEGPGALALLLALLCYSAAFAYAERRPGQGRNFYFYSTAGALLTLGGTSLVLSGAALPLAWCGAGLVSAVLGRRHQRMTLRAHGALFLGAGALQTGLPAACLASLGGATGAGVTATGWIAGAAAAAGWLTLARDASAPRTGAGRIPQMLLAIVVVLAVGRAAIAGLSWLLAFGFDGDAGAAAVTRTAVLAALALGLATLAGRGAPPELGWLVYPTVALGGAKLLGQDLRDGRPATLVLSLSLYGLVLTLAPKLLKGKARGEARPAEDE